jgi:TRAP-type C4-dicarboxylate transport system substrate-binding protein
MKEETGMRLHKVAFVVCATLALLASGAYSNSADAQEELNLRFADFLPATLPQTQIDQWFADELGRRSNGKIKIRIFFGGALGKATELLKLVSEGGVQIAATSPSYFPAQLPFMAPTNSLPLTFKDAPQAQKIIPALYSGTPAMQEEMRQLNLHPLFWHVLDPYYMICRTPVRSLADLKGKKIRSYGEDVPRLYQAVGAVPINLLPAELYESLQKGTIDCTPYSLGTAVSLKLYEVAKYVTFMSIGSPGGWPQFYNLKTWESFSPETKKLFIDVANDAQKLELQRIVEADAEARKTMKAAGVEFIDFPDQQKLEAMAPDFLQEWVNKMEKLGKGPEATRMAKLWRDLQK